MLGLFARFVEMVESLQYESSLANVRSCLLGGTVTLDSHFRSTVFVAEPSFTCGWLIWSIHLGYKGRLQQLQEAGTSFVDWLREVTSYQGVRFIF